MTTEAARPSPDAFLRLAKAEGRGRLKVFLGAAPGVGKTYAMLKAAQRAKADGRDVCVGLIETHGRAETEAQLAGLERLPRARIEYRGRGFDELDVPGIVRRRPQLVLVDEFAHSNIPGASHPKRHQDVDDLLDAGIDVWTTLNVQHLESLNDVVERITGIAVRETVPDEVLDRADEIELIDLPPEDLIRRLKEGKVYVPEQARQALNQFFGRGSLTALRELALRTAAEQIDAQMLEFKTRHAVNEPWPTRERLLVCVNEQDISQTVIRTARRIAEHRRIPWIAMHVVTPRVLAMGDEEKDRVSRNLRLAERLGAETVSVPANDLVATIIEQARMRNASQIVVGRPHPRRLQFPWTHSVAVDLMRRASPLDVTVVTWEGAPQARQHGFLPPMPRLHWPAFAWAAALSLGAAAVSGLLERFAQVEGLGVVFLLAVVATAVRFGLWPSLFSAALSAVLFNLLFTEPRYTLMVAQPDDVAALVAFGIAALLAGNLGGRLKSQLDSLKSSTRQAHELAEFSRRLTAAAEDREVVLATSEHLSNTLGVEAVILRPDDQGRLLVQGGSSNERPLTDVAQGAARWSADRDEPAGFGTDTLPASAWRFLPLATARRRSGVLGVHLAMLGREADAADLRLLQSIAGLAALALERTALAADLESSRVASEKEQLRTALLSSVSHDLRTPLVSVLGAAETLAQDDGTLSADARRELAAQVLDESDRLNRFVQNLLDMTRLSHGKLEPRLDLCDLRELAAGCRRRLARMIGSRELTIDAPGDLPMARVDPLLMEQVLVNLVDNALKYSPEDTPVTIELRAAADAMVIAVIDRGPGIAEADREKVFDLFFRVKAGDRRAAGTGLGLSICRGIVAAHGGSLRVLAGPGGAGTRMEIRLPHAARA